MRPPEPTWGPQPPVPGAQPGDTRLGAPAGFLGAAAQAQALGGGGYDSAWGNRAQRMLGLSAEDLNDPETRAWANRRMRKMRGQQTPQQSTPESAPMTPNQQNPETPLPEKGTGPAKTPGQVIYY